MNDSGKTLSDVDTLLVGRFGIGASETDPISKLKELCGGWTDEKLKAVVRLALAQHFVYSAFDKQQKNILAVDLSPEGRNRAESIINGNLP